MQKLNLTLSLAAGLLGGFISRNVALPSAYAQNPPPVTKEVRAQSFTLVDAMDRTVGTFMVEPGFERINRVGAQGKIVLRDPSGRELWSAGGSAIRPLSDNNR